MGRGDSARVIIINASPWWRVNDRDANFETWSIGGMRLRTRSHERTPDNGNQKAQDLSLHGWQLEGGNVDGSQAKCWVRLEFAG